VLVPVDPGSQRLDAVVEVEARIISSPTTRSNCSNVDSYPRSEERS